MNAGNFDQVLGVYRPVLVRNTLGEMEAAAPDFCGEIWAKAINPTSTPQQREIAVAGRAAAERIVTFIVRDGEDIAEGDSVEWHDERYAIEGLSTDRRRGEITFQARYLSGT